MQTDRKNLIVFLVFAALILIGYEWFLGPQQQKQAEAARAQAEQTASAQAAPAPQLSRAQALALSPRIAIDTPALSGSIALKGARIDDLFLKGYRQDLAKNSPSVELLRPQGMPQAYFAEQGWVGDNLPGLPTLDTQWSVVSGGTLSPGHPVVLSYASPAGLIFTRTLAVDDHYMFTISDTVANHGAAAVSLTPYTHIWRVGLPPPGTGAHEGAIGILDPEKPLLRLENYKTWKKNGADHWLSKGGWLGITDKYWMTAFIPGQSEHIDASLAFKAGVSDDGDLYQTAYTADPRTIAPGAQVTEVSHLFSGAKVLPLLNHYRDTLGVPRFDDAIDWGWAGVLIKPLFLLMGFLYSHVGNYGVAILILTLIIRFVTFPLANRGFEMGIKMKKIQPEMKAMQERLKDDPAAQQKEMMALYAREKINPVTGCLPMLLPIPLLFALTKLFSITIEMRQAPFFGWIHDLSARDPTTIFTLFGLIPWNPAALPLIGGILDGPLHVGVWPLLYGLSMWLSMSMSPQTGIDPAQRMMFKFMPLIFTFILAQNAVGLLIYWAFSSLLTIVQQYFMMHRAKVENPIDSLFARFSAKAPG